MSGGMEWGGVGWSGMECILYLDLFGVVGPGAEAFLGIASQELRVRVRQLVKWSEVK